MNPRVMERFMDFMSFTVSLQSGPCPEIKKERPTRLAFVSLHAGMRLNTNRRHSLKGGPAATFSDLLWQA